MSAEIHPEVTAFLDRLRRELVGVAREAARAVASEAASPWRDRKGAAAYMRCTPGTIDLYKRQGRLHPRYIGSKPVYAVADLDKLPSKHPDSDEAAA